MLKVIDKDRATLFQIGVPEFRLLAAEESGLLLCVRSAKYYDMKEQTFYLLGCRDRDGRAFQSLNLRVMDRPLYKRLPSLLYSKYYATATKHGDNFLLLGGLLRPLNKATKQCEIYSEGKWSSLPDMNYTRSQPGAVVIKDHLYCFGGLRIQSI